MRLIRPAVWSLAALAIVGCQPTAGTTDDVDEVVRADRVEIHDNAFDPRVVEVPAGSTVTWVFSDNGKRHNVVGDDFESDVVSDGTFTHTFTEPGTYDYACTLHDGMTGRVVVSDA